MQTEQYPPDGTYRVLRSITVDGQQLNRGDMLPQGLAVRYRPNRLEQLCRQRHLAPGVEDKPKPSPAAAPVAPKSAPVKTKRKK